MKKEDCNLLLSVVIPVYNVANYLDRCIKSILAQTYSNMEIILVDDGSKDNSGRICDEYAAEDDRIKVIHKENGGLVSARKAGLAVIRGKYATFVDSDDWIECNMYEELMALISDTEADVVTSGCIRDYGTHCVIQKEKIEPGIYEGSDLVEKLLKKMISTASFFESNIMVHVYNKIYKSELLAEVYNEVDNYINVGEDAACVYPYLLNADKVAVSGKAYYHYCIRNDSIMGTKKKDEWEREYVLFQRLEQECKKHMIRVPNIMKQIKMYEYHVMLLQQADKVIKYENGILFPFGKIEPGDRVIVYGAGRFGGELKGTLEKDGYCKVVAWVDKTGKAGTETIEYLDHVLYDKIIIAVLIGDVVAEIRKNLEDKGVSKEKIFSVDTQLLQKAKLKNDLKD